MKEIRVMEIRAETPPADGEKALILTGRPVVYETPTTIHDISGSYIEIVKRGALDGADLSDVRLLVGHDASRIPLARTPKTMSLTVDDDGLAMRAVLPDTEAGREAYEAVERGDMATAQQMVDEAAKRDIVPRRALHAPATVKETYAMIYKSRRKTPALR